MEAIEWEEEWKTARDGEESQPKSRRDSHEKYVFANLYFLSFLDLCRLKFIWTEMGIRFAYIR